MAADAEARALGDGEVHGAAVVDDALDGGVGAVAGGARLAEPLPRAAAAEQEDFDVLVREVVVGGPVGEARDAPLGVGRAQEEVATAVTRGPERDGDARREVPPRGHRRGRRRRGVAARRLVAQGRSVGRDRHVLDRDGRIHRRDGNVRDGRIDRRDGNVRDAGVLVEVWDLGQAEGVGGSVARRPGVGLIGAPAARREGQREERPGFQGGHRARECGTEGARTKPPRRRRVSAGRCRCSCARWRRCRSGAGGRWGS